MEESASGIFAEVSSKANFAARETEVLEFWDQRKIFDQSVTNRSSEKTFIFNDGPPFASGLPHYGHLLASIIKDVVPRYWTMRGFRVERRFGWDCHGLPVENEAERELGLKSRRDIIEYGVDRFSEACRGLVLRYTAEWERVIKRVGRWVDWNNQYRTMDPDFMESVWWVFKSLWDRDLIYEGLKSLAYCPRCATPLSNFEVNLGYQDTQDPSITVRFKVNNTQQTTILAWTTTPWTLPSNMALAVGPEIPYVRVTMKDGERIILARARWESVLASCQQEIDHVDEQAIDELLEMRYEPLFPYFASEPGAFRVIAAEFVTVEEGTGVVHIAPGFGEDDYHLGQRENLSAVCPIDEDCCFTSDVTDYSGTFVKDADTPIIRHLRNKGLLFSESTLVHSYPFCWRCETPLIYRAVSTWFVRVEQIKEQMQSANQQIWWIPEHIKDGRFGRWLEGARDWAISRNRYWGAPLPVWRNDDTGETLCIGSRTELEQLCGHQVADLHKHRIDHIEIPAPSGKGLLKRVPEVLDCWFESGSMPYGQSHYPFENRATFEANFPADFISEGLDQTRGWFYTLTVLGVALFDRPAFKNCIVSGMLLAENGRKMSKRLKNYPEPSEILETYGADALRLYLLNSAALKAEEIRLTERGIQQSLREVIIPLWNAYSFFVTYANIDGWTPAETPDPPTHRLDRWILSTLQTLVHNINTEMEAYRLYRTVPAMVAFVEQLTNWYIRRSRRRFWKSEDDRDKSSAYETLFAVLVTFAKSLAPVLPFVTELIYQNLVRRSNGAAPESVHLCNMPKANDHLRDLYLEHQMDLAARAVVLGRSLRNKHNLKTRQPLRRLFLLPPDDQAAIELKDMVELIRDELNVKEIVFIDDEAEFSDVSYRPNFRRLGPRFGNRIKEVSLYIESLQSDDFNRLRIGELLPIANGEIGVDDVQVQRLQRDGMVFSLDNNLGVGLDIQLSDSLVIECTARELVNRVQNMRKDAGLEVSNRIVIGATGNAEVEKAIRDHYDYITTETLADAIKWGEIPISGLIKLDDSVNGNNVSIVIARS